MKSFFNSLKNELVPNEEWPEIIKVTTASQKIKTAQAPKRPKRVDLKSISADDLSSIKTQDPFFYYSIPGVRSAKVLMKDIDTSNLNTYSVCRNCTSCPSRLQSVQGEAQTQTVTRSSRISFECHPDLLLEDLLNDDAEDDFDLDLYMATFNQEQQ